MGAIKLESTLLELRELRRLVTQLSSKAEVQIEAEVAIDSITLPIYSFAFGPKNKEAPRFLITAGIHGLERIGTAVALAYLRSFASHLEWDQSAIDLLQKVRVIFVPLVNPGGMMLGLRANPSGIDLMRNAPVEAKGAKLFGLVSGHRISAKLPWYRGKALAAMETEAQALCALVQRELLPAPFSIAIDLHSGFGLVDSLWFPYAKSHDPFEQVAQVLKLKSHLDEALPNHPYRMEPQSRRYLTHGDLWDYLYLTHRQNTQAGLFLPLTLEMGSWVWVKKNPRQMLKAHGLFNPILPHRFERTLRRHILLLDFLWRAAASFSHWANLLPEEEQALTAKALKLWYR